VGRQLLFDGESSAAAGAEREEIGVELLVVSLEIGQIGERLVTVRARTPSLLSRALIAGRVPVLLRRSVSHHLLLGGESEATDEAAIATSFFGHRKARERVLRKSRAQSSSVAAVLTLIQLARIQSR